MATQASAAQQTADQRGPRVRRRRLPQRRRDRPTSTGTVCHPDGRARHIPPGRIVAMQPSDRRRHRRQQRHRRRHRPRPRRRGLPRASAPPAAPTGSRRSPTRSAARRSTCDVTDRRVGRRARRGASATSLHVLVNNAGGAFGSDPSQRPTPTTGAGCTTSTCSGCCTSPRRCCPRCAPSGDGLIVNVGSTAGRIAYEGGGGYTAAKHGTQGGHRDAAARAGRRADPDQRDRARDGAHRRVRARSASTGTRRSADAVYAGVPDPLVAEDVADAIAWIATRPSHVEHRRAGDPAARPGRPAQGAPGLTVGPGDGPHRADCSPCRPSDWSAG